MRRSRSSRSFMSSVLETTWLNLPSFTSFFLFSIQSGTLNWRGFWMIVTRRSTSSCVSSPALRAWGEGPAKTSCDKQRWCGGCACVAASRHRGRHCMTPAGADGSAFCWVCPQTLYAVLLRWGCQTLCACLAPLHLSCSAAPACSLPGPAMEYPERRWLTACPAPPLPSCSRCWRSGGRHP